MRLFIGHLITFKASKSLIVKVETSFVFLSIYFSLLIKEKGTNSTHCSIEEKFNKHSKEANTTD
jgi:hypothetical protein